MRGSPLLRALIAFVVIALFGIPLWKLTHRQAIASIDAEAAPASAAQSVHLEFTLTQPAAQVSVWHLGRKVWSGNPEGNTAEADISIPWPREGVDLRVQIEWPADAANAAAARVQLIAPDKTEHERSIWSRGPADAVLTFR